MEAGERRMENRVLHRYWFEFKPGAALPGVGRGCGVTAHSQEDARALLAETVFHGFVFPQVSRLIEDVDVFALDPEHVLPEMLEPGPRGVWFPKGYR
jgi:hypothetical protein